MFLTKKEKMNRDDSIKWAIDNEKDGEAKVSEFKIKKFYDKKIFQRKGALFTLLVVLIPFSLLALYNIVL